MMAFFVCINILDIVCVYMCVCVRVCACLVFGYPLTVIFLWYIYFTWSNETFYFIFHLWNKVLHHLQRNKKCIVYMMGSLDSPNGCRQWIKWTTG